MDSLSQLSQNYRNQLRPMLEMLKSKKPVLKKQKWIEFVRMTEQSIVLSPEQYLSEFERNEATMHAVHQVFEEFIAELCPSNT